MFFWWFLGKHKLLNLLKFTLYQERNLRTIRYNIGNTFPLSANSRKLSNTFKQFLSVFDHFVGLTLKALCSWRIKNLCTFKFAIIRKGMGMHIWDALRDLVPFVQFEACSFTKSNTPAGVFSRFLNYTNSTKSREASNFIFFGSWNHSQKSKFLYTTRHVKSLGLPT